MILSPRCSEAEDGMSGVVRVKVLGGGFGGSNTSNKSTMGIK